MIGYAPTSSGACSAERQTRSRMSWVRCGMDAAMDTTRRSLLQHGTDQRWCEKARRDNKLTKARFRHVHSC